jgi:hypothetical protein
MRAYRFNRSQASAFQWLRKAGLLTAKTFVCLGLLSACQTRKESQTPSDVAVTRVEAQNSLVRSTVAPAPKPKVSPSRQDRKQQPDSAPPTQSQPLSLQVSERLRSSFEVTDIDGKSIRVRKSTAQSAVPSLFEEAIILGKLRAFLKSSSASENQSVSFHNGTATVSLSPKINSGTASVLIAKMLSLDGVNEVRAGFSD